MANRIMKLIACLLTVTLAFVNGNAAVVGKNVKGVVLDGKTGEPIEFATIALYKTADHTLFTGGITDTKGAFLIKNVPLGSYTFEMAYMGYVTVSREFVVEDADVNLGRIKLQPDVKQLATVDVVYDRAAVDYKIDKRVVNVGQQLNALSGTAIDVLENVPSIKVDIDGNVSMRGSSSFTVLIDGRPTPLDATDALRQIPASSIENIEIITNPSAKYEPDGASGVLNIITK